jgi:hypothetical protein
VVEVVAEFDGVIAAHVREGAGDLGAAFVRQCGAVERGRLADAQTGAGADERDLRRPAVLVLAEGLLKCRGRSAELGFEVAAVLHTELMHEVGGEKGVPAADEHIVGDVIVTKARYAIACGGLGKRAVGRVPAEIVVLDRDVVAIVELPVEFGKEDDLAGGAGHQTGLAHEAGDELLVLLERVDGQRHAEALAESFKLRRGE